MKKYYTHFFLIGILGFMFLLLVGCADTGATPNFPKDLGLNGNYVYSTIDWFGEYEELQEKVQPDDTVSFSFEGNLLGFSRAKWFTIFSTDTYRYFKVTVDHVIWKESDSGSEIILAKRNMSVGDIWNTELVWENKETVTYDYEVVDFLERYTLNSIEYNNVYVLEERLSSKIFDTKRAFYWIAHESGIIKAVSPAYYNGSYLPAVFEKI